MLLLSMCYHGNMTVDKENSNFSILAIFADHKENHRYVYLFRYFFSQCIVEEESLMTVCLLLGDVNVWSEL